MNMHWIDWTIVGGLFAFLMILLFICQKYVKSTADFLVANRCAGRYILSIAAGIAGIGAINIIGSFEKHFQAGFAPAWWSMVGGPIGLILSVLGWVYYRYRETRCMTMAQFFEIRYSRRFRIFTGMLAWLAGISCYGIFPAVSIRFFIFYCGLPLEFNFLGITFGTYPVLLAAAIGFGAAFAIWGGQIAIMVTDFAQGMFCNIAFLIIVTFFYFKFSWNDIFQPIIAAGIANPEGSLINPYRTTNIPDFNFWYYIMGICISIYVANAWQSSQGYNAAAISPHEAKMSRLLGTWRTMAQGLLLLLIPICAYAVMRNPAFSDIAGEVKSVLNTLDNPQLRKQLTVPVAIVKIMPVGMVGMFAAVMLSAMLSTDNTQMHSWGSIFVQDVIMPFRKKPLSPRDHMTALRISILFVAVLVFCFSYFFRQSDYIELYFQGTMAIFTAGAGAMIIGGLYTRWGTARGAWSSMIVGSTVALASQILQQSRVEWFLKANGRPLVNGQQTLFIAAVCSITTYVIVSLIDRYIHRTPLFNLEKMLHRGKYDTSKEHVKQMKTGGFLRKLGLTDEFSIRDRMVFFASLIWTFGWFILFIIATIYEVYKGVPDSFWISFWKFKLWFGFILGFGTTIWFICGGIQDVLKMFKLLRSTRRDDTDDGWVEEHE